jgi:hypothetical protein
LIRRWASRGVGKSEGTSIKRPAEAAAARSSRGRDGCLGCPSSSPAGLRLLVMLAPPSLLWSASATSNNKRFLDEDVVRCNWKCSTRVGLLGHVTNYFSFSLPTARMKDLRIFSHSQSAVRGSRLRAARPFSWNSWFAISSGLGKRSRHSDTCSRKTVRISSILGEAVLRRRLGSATLRLSTPGGGGGSPPMAGDFVVSGFARSACVPTSACVSHTELIFVMCNLH